MSLLDRVLGRAETPPVQPERNDSAKWRKRLVGGRRPSVEAATKSVSGYGSSVLGLINRTYGRRKSVLDTLKAIRDYNADASMAVWNFLRLANEGHEVEVYSVAVDQNGNPIPDQQGKAMLSELGTRVCAEYGCGADTLINILNLCILTQGAMALEVEFNKTLDDVEDLWPVDPAIVDFMKIEGHRVPVHYQTNTPLASEQFRYMPLDPDVEDPYGRCPLWPALESVFFKVEMLKDLKAVVHNQGYPRLDLKVIEKVIIDNAPSYLREPGNEEDLETFIGNQMAALQTQFNELEPDDTFIHFDSVEVGVVKPSGGMDFATIHRVVDTQIVAALKQLPVLLGRNEGATTTHASIQWQIYVAGIESLQRHTQRILEWAYNLALRIWGRQSYCKVIFKELRTVDRMLEAQAAQMETETRIRQVHAGWLSNDEAAMQQIGHAAVGPMLIVPAPSRAPNDGNKVPTSGSGTDEKKDDKDEDGDTDTDSDQADGNDETNAE